MYFLIDLILLSVVRPLRRRLVALKWVRWLREWVSTLNGYAALPVRQIGIMLPQPRASTTDCCARYAQRRQSCQP
jgi:hypothetical protein